MSNHIRGSCIQPEVNISHDGFPWDDWFYIYLYMNGYMIVGKYTIVPWILWFVESCFIKSMNKFHLEKLCVFCWHLCFVRIKRMELKTKPMILPRFWKKDNIRIGTRETKNKRRGSSCCCSTSLLYLDFGQKIYIFPLQNTSESVRVVYQVTFSWSSW